MTGPMKNANIQQLVIVSDRSDAIMSDLIHYVLLVMCQLKFSPTVQFFLCGIYEFVDLYECIYNEYSSLDGT